MGVVPQRSSIAEEEIHEILRNSRRRAVLQYLRRTIGSVSLRELSVAIAERESGKSPPPTGLRESVYNSLHQTHLPKLDREGVVLYDRNRKTIALEEPAREVDLYMEVFGPYGITWATFYRSLAIVTLVALLAIELSVWPVRLVPPLAVISASLGVIAVGTSYQLWIRRWMVLRALVG